SPDRGREQQRLDRSRGQRRFWALRCWSSSSPAGLKMNNENARWRMPLPSRDSVLLLWPRSRSSESTRINGSDSKETVSSMAACSANLYLHSLITGITHGICNARATFFRTQGHHGATTTAAGEFGAQGPVVTG